MASEVPPGWYPDPYGVPALLRWWDGVQWTAETAPAVSAVEQPKDHPTTELGTGTGASGGTATPAAYGAPYPATASDDRPPWDPPDADWGQSPAADPGQWDQPPDASQWGQAPDTGAWDQAPDADAWSQAPDAGQWDQPQDATSAPWPPQEHTGDPPATGSWAVPGAGGDDSGAPAVPSPWAADAGGQPERVEAPGIEWEPQAEPPPFDTGHGPPVADWEAPAGVTPWDDHQQTPWDGGQQPWTSAGEHTAHDVPDAAPPTFHWGGGQQPHTGAPTPPVEPYPDYGEPKRRGKGLLVGGIAGGLAIVLLLGVVGGVLFVNRDRGPTAGPSNSAPPSSTPASKPPDGPRVSSGGISYARLADPWGKPVKTAVKELEPNLGQVRVTQRNAPSTRGDWVAQVCVGALADRFDYSGPDDLESTTKALAKSVQDNYYAPLKTERKDVEAKRIEVSGKQGYQMRFRLDFVDPPDGFEAKGESVYVAVIGGEKPTGVYMTIPDNAPELEPTIDDVVASLQVGS